MRRLWVLAGVAGVIVIAGAGLALRSSQSGGSKRPISIEAVTKAFAAKGIVLELNSQLRPAPGERIRPPLGILWNQSDASRQGLVSVMVLRSAADTQRVIRYSKQLDRSARDTCGGTLSHDYAQLSSGNVVTTFIRCDYTHTPNHLVAATARSPVVAAMLALAWRST